jgi:general secretion pathway protein A
LLRSSEGDNVDVKKGSFGGGAGRVARGACGLASRTSSSHGSMAEIICYIRGLSVVVTTAPRDGIQYEEFYGFVQSPFTLAPDPRFLYLSPSHEEALQLLLQAINRKEGIIILTGDIGTGKTTLCRTVLERLDMSTFTSLVLNPFLSVEELLREVLLDFGVVSREAVRRGRVAAASKHELVTTLHEFLLSLTPIGGKGVLIIDEAQHLSSDVLEELRVLSNLETNQSKLLQIVLVGQLNLLTSLGSAVNRRFDQRVSLRAVLSPLTRSDVEGYIAHRLAISHGSSSVSFDGPALNQLHSASAGVPRVINLLCDRALMLGARFGLRIITADIITEAIQLLGIRLSSPSPRAWLARWVRSHRWLALGAAVLVLLALMTLWRPLQDLTTTELPEIAKPPAHPFAPPALPGVMWVEPGL